MSFTRPSALLCALALTAPLLLAQGAKPYENAEFGYRIRAPRGWTQIPLQTDERWQTAKWMSDRSYFYNEAGGWSYEHKPELVVIAFPGEELRKQAHKDEPDKDGEKKDGKDDPPKAVIVVQNPYKDYLDYLKQTNHEGGFYVSAQKDVDLGDHKATCYEIKIEKLASTGPKRIITWVHHAPLGDFAVQVDVLEDSFDKLEKTVLDAQKSFALIASAGPGLGAAAKGEKLDFTDEAKLGAAERKERRLASEKLAHDKAKSTVTQGWQVLPAGRVLVLSHADEKFARRIADEAEAVVKWCEATFPFVGPEEYVRKPVLRVCADFNEYRSFYGGSGMFFFFSCSVL